MKDVDVIEYLLNLEEWNEFIITNEFGNLTLRPFPSSYIPKFIINNTLDKLFDGSDDEVKISGNDMLDRLGYLFESLGNYLVETSKEFNNNKFPELFLKISKLVCLIETIFHMMTITPKFDNEEKDEEETM